MTVADGPQLDTQLTLPLTHGSFSREKLEKFIATVPPEVPFAVETRITEPDRQGETRISHATLVARWKV